MKRFLLILLLIVTAALHGAPWSEGTFDWRQVKSVAPGIERAEFKYKKPRLISIHALRIDLTNPKLHFHVTPKAENYGQKMPDAPKFTIRTRRETTRNFFRGLRERKINVVAAVNATPWSPWEPPFTHTYADRMGFLVSDGVVVMPPDGKRPSLIVTKDGKVDLATIPAKADISHIRHAVSGFGFVLSDGVVKGGNKALAPRTGYGISKDRKYLYIFVADGRQPKFSMGFTHREVGEFLRYLGAYNGLNMDGGGSTTMIVRKGRKEQMLNHQPGKGERLVGASLGISISR